MRATDKRMTSERCAFLSLVAIAHKLEEAWLCFFPVLPLMYISQYLPTIGKRFVVPSRPTISDGSNFGYRNSAFQMFAYAHSFLRIPFEKIIAVQLPPWPVGKLKCALEKMKIYANPFCRCSIHH